MSKTETDLPERLSSVDASPLEQRLLRAAGSELPSAELSARMARAIGVSLPAAGLATAAGSKTAAAATKAAGTSALVPWITGVVAAAVVTGAFVVTQATPTAKTPTSTSAPMTSSVPVAPPPTDTPTDTEAPARPKPEAEDTPKAPVPSASSRGRTATTAGELAAQIALVDAARSALATGGAARALTSVREYQTQFPNGAFRPEVAAIKIEALLKLGRTSEARAAAERFRASYGPGPLADRVARLVGTPQP